MSSAVRILCGLFIGLAVGALIQRLGPTLAVSTVHAGKLIGGLWINALRMTVIPLILSLVVTGVASAMAAARAGALTSRTIGVFLVFLALAGTLGAVSMTLALGVWAPDPMSASNFVNGLPPTQGRIPSQPETTQLLRNVIPSNPVQAAAEGSILQLVCFALFLGFAIGSLAEEVRSLLLRIFEGIADAMLKIVSWVLLVAPVGVFALALTLSAMDLGTVGVLLNYLLLACGVALVGTLAAYVLAVFVGGKSFTNFLRSVAPAQVIAISTQSSLASLPAMLKGAQEMGVREEVFSLTLPLAVSMFRFSNPLVNCAIAIYAAHLYGIPLHFAAVTLLILTAVLTNFSTVGVSSQVSYFAMLVPLFSVLGVPPGILAIFIAIETIPDMFRTLGNVSMDFSVTAIIDRWLPVGQREPPHCT